MTKPMGLPLEAAATSRRVISLFEGSVPPSPMWYWPSDIRTLRFSLTSLLPVPNPAVAGWNDDAACWEAVVIAACSEDIHRLFNVVSLGSCGVVMVWFEWTQMLFFG